MGFYQDTGELILGTRLKRISDRFMADVSRTYKTLGIDFEMSWFPLIYLLHQKGEQSVTEVARELEITHPAISQMVRSLSKRKLIILASDPGDGRRRLIRFTTKGQALVETLLPVWQSIKRSMAELLDERENNVCLLTFLTELEGALSSRTIYDRIMEDIRKNRPDNVIIRPYSADCLPQFKSLILGWFSDNIDHDLADMDLLNDPEPEIQNGTHTVFVAEIGDVCVGTIVARHTTKSACDIRYFVVSEEWQRQQIGQKLLTSLINHLKKQGISTLVILLDRRFSHAIKLLKRSGFTLKENGSSQIQGTTFTLECRLDSPKERR